MDIRVIVGRNIRRLRKTREWSQEELAHRSGLHRTYISDVERGNRNISVVNVHKIALALGVPAAELLEDDSLEGQSSRQTEG